MKTFKLITVIIFITFLNKVIAQPTLSIGTPSPATANSSSNVDFLITYTGATSVNLLNTNVTINHSGTADGTITIQDGTTSTPTVRVTGVTGNGSYTISIAAGTSTDGTNPDLGAGPSSSVTVDNAAPTVTIGTPSLTTVNSSSNVDFPITYTGASTINLLNTNVTINHSGTADGTITIQDGTTSTPTVRVTGVTGNGSYTISIAAGTSTDGLNPDLGAGPSSSVTVDNAAPTVTIGTPSASTANSSSNIDFPITYTGASTINLLNTNVTINHTGTAGGTITVQNGTTSTPTVRVTGVTGNGSYTISIAAGTSTDGLNPDLGAGPSSSVTVDNTAPTVTIGTPSPTTANSSTNVDFPITYTGASTINLLNTNVTINHSGTAGGTITVQNGTTSTPTVRVTGVTGNGSYTISIAAGTSTDGLNPDLGAGPSSSVTVDNSAPTVTIGTPSPTTANSSSNVDFPITYTGASTINLLNTNVTINHSGTAGGTITVQNGTTSTPTVRVTGVTGNGSFTITIAAGTSSDGANADAGAGPSSSVTVDNIAPSVSSVTVPANGTYTKDDVMDFYVNYNEAVIVNTSGGVPYITLTFTSSSVHAQYVSSGSTSTSLHFSYTVLSGDTDGNGIVVNTTLTPNGGTIKDAAGNIASNTLTSIGSTTNIFVDGAIPTVQSVEVPAGGYYKAGSMSFKVNFDRNITVTGTPYIQITLNTGGNINANYSTGSGTSQLTFTCTIVSGNLDLDGITVASSITKPSGASLKYGSSNADLTLYNLPSTAGIFVDAVAPTVSSVAAPASATYAIGQSINISVSFSEIVNVDITGGTPYIPITLNTGGTVNALYQSGSGSSTLIFSYTVISGNNDSDGIAIGSSINPNSGTIKDVALNNINTTLNNIQSFAGVKVDGIRPTVSSVSVPANGYYKEGQTLNFTVNFNELVNVNTTGGTPTLQITLNTGGTVNAAYVSGSGSSALLFQYSVVSGNNDNDGIVIGSSIVLNLGTIQDQVLNDATLTLNNVGNTSGVFVDSNSPTLPIVYIFSNNSTPDKVGVGGKVFVSFTASETLDASGFTGSTIDNQVATISGSGTNWTASYTMQNSNTEGPVTFLIKYKDLAGNLGTDVGSVTNGSSVSFDKTSPNVSGVTFLSNNSNSTLKAKVGDKITISYAEPETVTDVAIKVNGKSITPSYSGSTWTGEYTMLSSDAEGALFITFECKDLAGNLAQTSNSSIIFDKTPPTFTAISIASNNSTNTSYAKLNDNVIVTFTTNETCGTPTATINGNPATIALVGGNTWTATRKIDASDNEVAVTFNISIVDAYGNSGTAGTVTTNGSSVLVDKTAPTISAVTVPSGSYGIGSVIIVTVNADASGYSGETVKVNNENCSLIYSSGTTYKIYYNVLYSSTNLDKVPMLPINLQLKDLAGNISTEVTQATVQGGTLTINTKPTYHITGTTSRCASSATAPVTFTFTGYPPFDFTYTDSINAGSIPVNGWMSYTYVVDATAGTFRIASLKDNSTNFATILTTEKAKVTENLLPSITFNPTSLAYNNTDPEVNLMTFVSPSGGHFSGEGVSTSNYFYPTLATAGIKAITYTYTNPTTGCTNTKILNITITNNSEHLDGISAIYCKDKDASTSVIITAAGITATTKDEFFTLTPSSSKANTVDKTHFNLNPKEMKAGNYNLTYTYTNSDNGITSTFGSDFVIDSIGTLLDFKTLDTSYCNGAGEVVLVGENIYPSQGTGHFTGPATGFFTQSGSNSATFTPSIAPKDQKISISYYYESLSGCRSVTITKDTKVHTVASASFTTLKANYNFVETPIVLVGTPSSDLSSFQGALIEGASTLNPSKADATNIGLPIKITYTYVDSITGCSSIKEQTTTVYKASELIKVVKADYSLVNLDGTYCYVDTVFNISCTPVVGGTTYKGIFTSTKGAINQTTTPSNTATFDLAKAVKVNLVDTIRFKYTVGPTDYEIEKVVVIDSVGPVALNIKDNYCKYEEPLTIVGDHRLIPGINTYTYTGSTGFSSNAIFATFSPKLAEVGTWNITYKFTTTSEKQCSNSVTKTIYVNPISNVDFKLNEDCPGINKQIKLVNKSTIPAGATMTWTWTWEGGGSSAADTAIVSYIATGLKTITLTAKTDKNCTTSKSSQITIGLGAKADFKWSNDCLSSDSVKFTNLSSGGTLDSVRWELNGVYNKGTLDSTKCLFTTTGSNTMKLWVQTIEGCKDEITKQIVIQPFYSINSFYLDSLDASKKEWNAKGIEEGGYSSWVYGLPTGDIFNKAASGKTAWYTNVGLSNQHIENSQVISPCFDLSHLKKPMIKLNIWSAPEAGRDGAVLEYSTDGGQTWPVDSVLGEPDKGINWYDPGNLSSQPAGQSLGWSSSDAVTSWKSARYTLDTIKNRSNVRFRIVYATKADNNKKFNGFAFDDVWIGERQQMVLNEVFTNVSDGCDAGNAYLKGYEKRRKDDVIPIHYHTSNPSGDPFYTYYTTGPLSRGFFYGASAAIPYVFLNGSELSTIVTSDEKDEFEENVIEKTLTDPYITISNMSATQGNLSVSLTANKDLSGENLVLFCALVKDTINIGSDYYYNVLRKFYPNPGGSLLSNSTWLQGQTINQTIPISFDNSGEILKAKIVVFVQNVSTNKIYQAAAFSDLQTILSNQPIDISNLVDVYPNPTRDYLIVECQNIIDKLLIFDMTGRVVGNFTPAQEKYTIPVNNMQNGIYIIKGSTKKGQFIRKFIKQ